MVLFVLDYWICIIFKRTFGALYIYWIAHVVYKIISICFPKTQNYYIDCSILYIYILKKKKNIASCKNIKYIQPMTTQTAINILKWLNILQNNNKDVDSKCHHPYIFFSLYILVNTSENQSWLPVQYLYIYIF